ncbi:MAG: transcriptional regulator with GAF, ATPase, and Fis domain [Pirellulaceae bacterium]|jgi:transcriptional regulator with GAF, ATPase, and Fis domain
MPELPATARFGLNPWAQQLSPLLLAAANRADDSQRFATRALEIIRQAIGADETVLARGTRGRWRVSNQSGGETQSAPDSILAEVLDTERPTQSGDWVAAAVSIARGEVFAARRLQSKNVSLPDIDAIAGILGEALLAVRGSTLAQRRIRRLEAILEIAASWQQTQEMDELLTQMAETSTRLLNAERASIFLWDRTAKTLVGRPALGVEGGELRIPDNAGIVGEVVQTGQPLRVDQGDDASVIDRHVDEELNFQTRTLLCVPLFGQSGELFGAFEMINKIDGSFTDDDESALVELATHAAIALENTQQVEQLIKTRNQIAEQSAGEVQLIGQCPAVEALRSTVQRVANTDLAILVLGENGTGKEVVSQMIHYLSRRRHEPLVAVNCAAMTETLLESELFGHEKGAFTDAHDTRIGKFELASGGTLFLDEIGDMSLSGQAKLLRVLEEKIVVRVGGSTNIHTDARVVAATNQNLTEMVREKRFREDLYFRLNVVTLDIPALRQRGEDIIVLAEHFLRNFCIKARRKPPKFSAAAKKRLLGHAWPGNVRELRNLMERLAYLSAGDKVDAEDLAFILSPNAEGPAMFSWDLPLADATKSFQVEYIKKLVEQSRGNMTETAKRLGLHRSNLYRKMRQLDMDVEEE